MILRWESSFERDRGECFNNTTGKALNILPHLRTSYKPIILMGSLFLCTSHQSSKILFFIQFHQAEVETKNTRKNFFSIITRNKFSRLCISVFTKFIYHTELSSVKANTHVEHDNDYSSTGKRFGNSNGVLFLSKKSFRTVKLVLNWKQNHEHVQLQTKSNFSSQFLL